MTKSKAIALLICLAIISVFLVPQILKPYRGERPKPKPLSPPTPPIQAKISRTEAIALAKEAAAKAGYKVDDYYFQISEATFQGRPEWDFYFELKRAVDYLGGDQHFGVSVDKETGETKVFGGR